MQVNDEHHERAAAVANEFFQRMVAGACIDRGALTLALFDLAMQQMAAQDGAEALSAALRGYAEAYDQRRAEQVAVKH